MVILVSVAVLSSYPVPHDSTVLCPQTVPDLPPSTTGPHSMLCHSHQSTLSHPHICTVTLKDSPHRLSPGAISTSPPHPLTPPHPHLLLSTLSCHPLSLNTRMEVLHSIQYGMRTQHCIAVKPLTYLEQSPWKPFCSWTHVSGFGVTGWRDRERVTYLPQLCSQSCTDISAVYLPATCEIQDTL